MGVFSESRKYSNEIIELYSKEKISTVELAKKFNCGETTIRRILKENNVEIRKLSESCDKYKLDFSYFDNIDNQNKAYILGLLYADGLNYKKQHMIKLSLQDTDKDILEKIREDMKIEKPLVFQERKKYNPNNKNSYAIIIYDEHMSNRLEELGVVERKSLVLEFPNWLNDCLISHFIRGYFDGDGSIAKSEKGANLTIVSSTKFIKGLSEYINDKIEIPHYTRILKSNENTSYFYITKKCDVKNFMDWMYKDANLYMNRKFEIYLNKFYSKNN